MFSIFGNRRKSLQPYFSRHYNSYDSREGFSYANYRQQVLDNYLPYSNPFSCYQYLIESLQSNSDIELRRMANLNDEIRNGKKVISLRHDVDADPEMGVRMAQFLASKGIPSTFYLLHSALYYGQFLDGIFCRNPLLTDWLKCLLVSGCEIGLHTDALGINMREKINGAQALVTELGWIRSNGVMVTGTAAHNSFPIHQAENFEVFSEYLLWDRKCFDDDGNLVQLKTLSSKALGLEYEANFPIPKSNLNVSSVQEFLKVPPNTRSEEWMRWYLLDNPYMDKEYDVDIWLIGQNQWACCSRIVGKEYLKISVTLPDMLDFLYDLPPNTKTVIVLHPEFFRIED